MRGHHATPSRTMQKNGFWFIWRAPSILAGLTLFGLLAALLGTGAWHFASWCALAVPPIVCVWLPLSARSR